MTSDNKTKVRYAVIGAGNIAQVAVLPAFEHAKENSELVAIVSGDAEKRAALCKEYSIEAHGGYEDLERIIAEARVNAVYVATPNALHVEHSVRSASAGAHVLCEKPLAPSVAECEEIIRACDEAGVKLMVAYRLHFEEANLKAIEIATNGTIGDPMLFDSVFTHVVRPDDVRERPELAGGAVLDLGIYCINAARNLFRDEPISVFATAHFENGVDDTTTAVLRFARDRVAQFTVSNSLSSVSSYRIAGTEGDLRVEPAYEYAGKLEHHLTIDERTTRESFGKRDQFAPELIHFSRCIQEDRAPEPSGDEGVCDLRVIEAILESANTGRSVELPPRRHAPRPSMKQELKKPPVRKKEPVKAPSPSVK